MRFSSPRVPWAVALLVAHPELLAPRQPYRPEWELDLLDLNRVVGYLTLRAWIRTVSEVGRVSLGGLR